MVDSLYIHIPFCEHICEYCDFAKLIKNQEFEDKYLNALFKEINSYKIGKVKTIYIGGGTPTALSDTNFESLLKKVTRFKKKHYEFTVEGNVENITDTKLDLMLKYGVNRLSIGVQSSDDEILKAINRHHTFLEAKELILRAKAKGFNNLNVDLIYGLNNQDILKELDAFISLNTEHISIYSLSISKGSIFYNKKYKTLDQDKDAEIYEFIHKYMNKHGYNHYEISNFAKKGYESKHNLTYWKDNEYYGIGLGASGYLNGIRYKNTSSLKEYLNLNYVKEKEAIDKVTMEEEFLMLTLRLKEGFKRKDYISRFNVDFIDKYIDKLSTKKLLKYFKITKKRVKPTFKLMEKLDFVLLQILSE